MKKNFVLKCLLASVLPSVGAFAEMDVVKSSSSLTIASTLSGTVLAKVVGPNDEVLVNEKYEGSSFSWTPSVVDGVYRYEVRVIPQIESTDVSKNQEIDLAVQTKQQKSDVAIGSVEVRDGKLKVNEKRGS